jgi:hypothetical protein
MGNILLITFLAGTRSAFLVLGTIHTWRVNCSFFTSHHIIMDDQKFRRSEVQKSEREGTPKWDMVPDICFWAGKVTLLDSVSQT